MSLLLVVPWIVVSYIGEEKKVGAPFYTHAALHPCPSNLAVVASRWALVTVVGRNRLWW